MVKFRASVSLLRPMAALMGPFCGPPGLVHDPIAPGALVGEVLGVGRLAFDQLLFTSID